MDARGNFEDIGERYQDGRTLEQLTTLILEAISKELPNIKATAVAKKYSMGRSINILVLDAGEHDLTQRDVVDALKKRISDIVKKFNFERGNPYQDSYHTSFYSDVRIEPGAFMLHATRTGQATNEVEGKLSLAEFKRQLKPGDIMELVHGGRLGTRVVKQVRSKDIVFDGPSYLDFGRAGEFACDGELVRFSRGNEYDPGRHILFRWRPVQAMDQTAA